MNIQADGTNIWMEHTGRCNKVTDRHKDVIIDTQIMPGYTNISTDIWTDVQMDILMDRCTDGCTYKNTIRCTDVPNSFPFICSRHLYLPITCKKFSYLKTILLHLKELENILENFKATLRMNPHHIYTMEAVGMTKSTLQIHGMCNEHDDHVPFSSPKYRHGGGKTYK